jgi:C1A family cysteine protease
MPPIEFGFGRRFVADPRDRRFTLGERGLNEIRERFFPRGIPTGSCHFMSGAVLNQGNTGTCVAHATKAKMAAAPIMQALPNNMSVFDLYRLIVVADEFGDNDFEAQQPDTNLQFGTSIRGAAKSCRSLGLIEEYLWAESSEDARAYIMTRQGGLVAGFNWRSGQMDTDSEGFVSYTGSVEGGHAFYINGWSDKVRRGGKYVRAARAQNSWGTEWGQKGRFWIVEDDLHRMIQEEGELCAMREIRLSKREPIVNEGGDPAKR